VLIGEQDLSDVASLHYKEMLTYLSYTLHVG
jgi:hypothetical protein